MDIMEEDKAALMEKIIKELNHVISKPDLLEFDIVPAEAGNNKSPVLFEENTVGLESWCIKPVYMYCYNELMDTYFTNPKNRFNRPSLMNQERLTSLLNAVLLINPDVLTFWNKRKEMFHKQLTELTSELQFVKLVLSRKPKCSEAFVYRRWILEELFRRELNPIPNIESIINEELLVCNMTADKCPSNYHSWDHRRWTMEIAWRYRLEFDYARLFFIDYQVVIDWSMSHVSDYSALHYRQFLLKKIYYINPYRRLERILGVNFRQNLEDIILLRIPHCSIIKPHKTFKKFLTDDELITLLIGFCPINCICYATFYATIHKVKILMYELLYSDDLLDMYRTHESLWRHRTFIINEIIDAMCIQLELDRRTFELREDLPPPEARRARCPRCNNREWSQYHEGIPKTIELTFQTTPLYKILIKHEKDLMKSRVRGEISYADRHEDFLLRQGFPVFWA